MSRPSWQASGSGSKGFMDISHTLLTRADGRRQAEERVRVFFRDYELVFYERILIDGSDIIPATSPSFMEEAERGMDENREVITKLLDQLSDEGYAALPDLGQIPQGYLSKVFHTLAHLLDGFFGVDSRFYNLEEGSHWVSRRLVKQIQAAPDRFWLVRALGSISDVEDSRFKGTAGFMKP